MAKAAPFNLGEQAELDALTARKVAEEAIKNAFPAASSQAVSTVAPSAVPAGMSYAELMTQADAIVGHDLERDKLSLVGIPFVITGVVYRDGILRNKQPTNYLSVEIVIADGPTLARAVQRGRLSVEQANRFLPNEMVVFNDGSTGIARQVTAYLHGKGLITVPEGPNDGAVGESRWDVYRAQWAKGYDVDNPNPRFDIILSCPRGLRVSEYTNTDGLDGDTFYLA